MNSALQKYLYSFIFFYQGAATNFTSGLYETDQNKVANKCEVHEK